MGSFFFLQKKHAHFPVLHEIRQFIFHFKTFRFMQNRKRLFSRLKNDYIFFIVNQIEDSEGNAEWYRCELIKILFFDLGVT